MRGDHCRIFGDGETTRDFCYVANVIQANLLGTVCPDDATGEVYNVACADSITLNQLFRMICDRLAIYDPRFARIAPVYDDFRHGDIRFSTASIEKARRMLGFSPTHNVGEGLTEAMAWYVAKARAARHEIAGARSMIAQDHSVPANPLTLAAS